MRDRKEIVEAVSACDELLANIDEALSYLSSASTWALWDIFGGDFLASFMKRSKMRKANEKIYAIKPSLVRLKKELKDVDIDLPDELSDSFYDNLFDLYFDNIFTDLRVRSELKEKTKELTDLRAKVSYLREELGKNL